MFQNSCRMIPTEKVSSLEILSWESAANKETISNSTIKVKTKTGVEVTSTYNSLWRFWVKLLNELTGEITLVEYHFAENGKLNIKRIDFY
jgi:hypothetical protein